MNLSSARAIMTLDLPQQVPPDQLAHSSKVQELQRAFATSDYCLLTSDLYRVKCAYFAAVAYLETNNESTAERVRNYLAADQPGGETLLVFDTGCAPLKLARYYCFSKK